MQDGSDAGSSAASSASSSSAASGPPVGVARMLPDGTLELDLHSPSGAEARVTYPPSHPRYAETLKHVGGLKKGEEKPVPPWPDPWDAAKVEGASHALAASKGWAKADYTVTIMGTNRAGDAVVSVSHADDHKMPAPAVKKSLSIVVSAKTYAVVSETPIR